MTTIMSAMRLTRCLTTSRSAPRPHPTSPFPQVRLRAVFRSAVRDRSTSPTNGDSSIVQTFTAPAGSTRVSFWYKMTCPDTITYDWATATLRDNTTGTTTTILPKVCATNSTWVQDSASITAGHSYTLTLISHDDNYVGDATYTLFDDVTTQ